MLEKYTPSILFDDFIYDTDNLRSIAFASHLNHNASICLQRSVYSLQNRPVVNHPMKNRIGKDDVKLLKI